MTLLSSKDPCANPCADPCADPCVSSCDPKPLDAFDGKNGDLALDDLGRKWCKEDSGCCMKSAGRLSGDSGRDASGGPWGVSRASDAVWDKLGSMGCLARSLDELTGECKKACGELPLVPWGCMAAAAT